MDAMIANSLMLKTQDGTLACQGEYSYRKELENMLANDELPTERSNKVEDDTMRMESKLQHANLELGENELEVTARPKIIVRERSNQQFRNLVH